MDKEIIDKKIKHKIELFKVYAIFVIALGSGNVSLFLFNKGAQTKDEFYLLVAGIVLFIMFVILFVRSYIIIVQLLKKLS
jgi:hypothetical protein